MLYKTNNCTYLLKTFTGHTDTLRIEEFVLWIRIVWDDEVAVLSAFVIKGTVEKFLSNEYAGFRAAQREA
jgi:hypothetical protein